jgi:peptide/nickel transport system ATP-binding protein
MDAHVKVEGLTVSARSPAGVETVIVKDIRFSIKPGEVLALIGESGSGKTTIALALMGYARPGTRIGAGEIHIGDTAVRELDPRELADLRGNGVAYIAQSAAAAFNPSRTILSQVIEPALIHGTASRSDAEAKAVELFRELALPNPETIGSRYPHQVSGGQLQRLMAAMALITQPELVILDEPTTALDVTTQIEVLKAFKTVVRDRGTTAVYVSHDLAVVAQMADQIVVLNRGNIRETGATATVLYQPADEYTCSLMAAARPAEQAGASRGSEADTAPLLEVRGLTAGYGAVNADGLPKIPVLHDINLTIERGSTLGVIGESGSGKSTLARVIAGLLKPANGEVRLGGETLPGTLAERTREQFRRIQIVFQNADTALNPGHTVGQILARPLVFYHGMEGAAQRKRVAELLDLIRLPASIADRLPGELSGGQKQRVNLARALAADPDLILCDEVTSALDTVVGAAILELLAELRRELNLSYLFISHDISTVRAICDDIVVLYSGRQVELAPRAAFREPPFHPYTNLLVESVPELRPGWLEESGSAGPLPALDPPANERPGELCAFVGRCPVRINGLCNAVPPPRHVLGKGNEVLCHHNDETLIELHRKLAGGGTRTSSAPTHHCVN